MHYACVWHVFLQLPKASWGDNIRSGGVRETIEDGGLKLYISGDFPGL